MNINTNNKIKKKSTVSPALEADIGKNTSSLPGSLHPLLAAWSRARWAVILTRACPNSDWTEPKQTFTFCIFALFSVNT